MAQHRQGLGVTRGQDAHAVAVGQRQTEIAQLASDLDGDRRLGQSRADRLGGVETGRAVGQLDRGAVGECDMHGGEHTKPPRWYARCVQAVTITLALALVVVSAIAVRIALDRTKQRARYER